MYHNLGTAQSHVAGTKRPRSDDLDLGVAGLSDLDHGDIDSIHSSSLGPAYTTQPSNSRPVHHHHRLPDQPPAKMMRHDDGALSALSGGGAGGGGAPSVVGQAGMPDPAPRPRGPKLKFTPEDDQLLIDLKENKNLTWKQIADFFPGRSSGTLQVRYCTKLKAKATQWNDEMVSSRILLCPTQTHRRGYQHGVLTHPFMTGPEVAQRYPRLGKREVALCVQQSRTRLHAACLPAEITSVIRRDHRRGP